jgi:hypothetical protein
MDSKMNDESILCVVTCSKEDEAEMVRTLLESNGIESFISRDDCGGWDPWLQTITGLRVMVKTSDAEGALAILKKNNVNIVID